MSSSLYCIVRFSEARQNFRLVLHFYSIATGGAHPSAHEEMIPLGETPTSRDDIWFQLIICGPLIGVVTRPRNPEDSDHFRVFSWRTSFIVQVRTAPSLAHHLVQTHV